MTFGIEHYSDDLFAAMRLRTAFVQVQRWERARRKGRTRRTRRQGRVAVKSFSFCLPLPSSCIPQVRPLDTILAKRP